MCLMFSVTVSNALPKWHFDKIRIKKKRPQYSLPQTGRRTIHPSAALLRLPEMLDVEAPGVM